MVLPPGNFCDLDTLTEKAIRQGTPNLVIKATSRDTGTSLLLAVCIHERLDLAELLFSTGATMTASDLLPLIWWDCTAATLRFLLSRGVPFDNDCLDNAVRHAKWELVVVLLEHGLAGDTKLSLDNKETTSLLHVAVRKGLLPLLLALLERETDADVRDSEGYTPLLKACHFDTVNSPVSPGFIYWLLKYGADPNAALPSGETALVLCLSNPFKKADRMDYFFMRRTSIAQTLLRFGANPNVTAPNGATPLMFAARDNDGPLARTLLRFGAKTDTRTPKGENVLDVAKRWKSDAVKEVLLSR